MPMAILRALPKPTNIDFARKRIEPEFTHWQIAVAESKHQSMRQMRERVEEERRIVVGLGYVMDWDADRFSYEA